MNSICASFRSSSVAGWKSRARATSCSGSIAATSAMRCSCEAFSAEGMTSWNDTLQWENMRLTAITPFLALGEPIPMIGFSGSFNRKGKRALPLS